MPAAARRFPDGGRLMSATELYDQGTLELSVRELWCRGCGYGVVIRREPPECPICRQTSWRERALLTRFN
jgi:rubrerythrin